MIPSPVDSAPVPRVVVFVCYASADVGLREELERHLAPLLNHGPLELRHAGRIGPGADTGRELDAYLDESTIVLALTTANLLACSVTGAILARARQQRKTIVPILATPCLWEASEELASGTPLPADKRAISLWPEPHAAWTEIAKAILAFVKSTPKTSTAPAQRTPDAHTPRARWLRMIIDAARRRRLLGGLTVGGLRVDLGLVRVPVRVALDQERTVALPPLDQQLLTARTGTRLVLVGDVGTGKSELLYETAARLAEHAQENLEAPVPVLVRARDVGAGLDAALRAIWTISDDISAAVVSEPTGLVLLVDGLDEAGSEAPEQIESLADSLGDRCHALVVATRPVHRFRDLHADERWLTRWSPEEADRFLDLCATHVREPAQRLLAARASLPPELLETPLTASMCLLVAEREREALNSRVTVFRAVVRRLVDDWAARRNLTDAPVGKILSGLETLALEVVRGEVEAITEAHLIRVFGQEFPYRESAAIETLECHLGLLVRRANGDFDFALRSLAEHLAGRALLAQGDEAIVAAAKTTWGTEAVRHAVGLASMDDGPSVTASQHRASALIAAILEGEEEDDIVFTNRHLRAVLAAVRAATDLPRITKRAQARLQGAVWRRVWDETSVWVGDRVAAVVADCVRVRPGHVKDVLVLAIQGILQTASRVSWLAREKSENLNEWCIRLYERDAAVRWLATERLSPFRDDLTARTWLLTALKDDGMFAQPQPVPFAAGSALRHATRDAHFQEHLPYLHDLLEHGDAFQQVGAAIAFLPGEADAQKRAVGLCRGLGGSGFGVPREVLEEVAADPAGRAELERCCPDWATKSKPDSVEPLAPDWEGPEPASPDVRQRLVQLVAPALRNAERELLGKLKTSASLTLPLVACDLALDVPELVCALLKAAPDPPLSLYWDPELDKLGRAAVRHPSVRDELVGLWVRIQAMPATERRGSAMADYPGRALEGLIRKGDDPEAERMFAEWLPCGRHSIPMRTFGAPLLEAFECPPIVRDAGHAIARQYFSQSETAMRSSVAEGLFRLSSFWQQDMDLRHGVEAWLSAGDFEKFTAGVWALQSIGLTDEARVTFRSDVGKLLDPIERAVMWPGWLRNLPILHRMTLLDDIRDLVEFLAELTTFAVVAVPLTFSWHRPAECRARSERVAENLQLLDFVPEYLAARLVEAAPLAWAERLEQMLVGASSMEDLLPFIRSLPVPLRTRVVERWAPTAAEYPWVGDGLGGRCVRPADKVGELLFDLGLEEPPDEELPAAGTHEPNPSAPGSPHGMLGEP